MEFIKGLISFLTDSFSEIVAFIVRTVGRFGYGGIILLMGLESSFVPFPSEVVIPPAGYLVSHGQMNIFFVIISGIFGSILGSLLNYWLAARFGRAFLLKYSRFFFLNEAKFAKFEQFFNKHGEITTFVGRLIPVIRQYISFPAGLVRMNLLKFVIYTGLGATIWVTILAYIGYFVGNNIDLVKEHLHTVTFVLVPVLSLLVIVYIIFQRYRRTKAAAQ